MSKIPEISCKHHKLSISSPCLLPPTKKRLQLRPVARARLEGATQDGCQKPNLAGLQGSKAANLASPAPPDGCSREQLSAFTLRKDLSWIFAGYNDFICSRRAKDAFSESNQKERSRLSYIFRWIQDESTIVIFGVCLIFCCRKN